MATMILSTPQRIDFLRGDLSISPFEKTARTNRHHPYSLAKGRIYRGGAFSSGVTSLIEQTDRRN